jgi:hypothetical protein
MMIRYTDILSENSNRFESLDLQWKENDLIVNFKKEGWITESFIVLKSYTNEIDIKSIFLIFKENNIIYKERINIKKLKDISYKRYIGLLTDRNMKLLEGSDNYDFKNIEGIEIRTYYNNNKFPTVTGCKKIIELINWEIST